MDRPTRFENIRWLGDKRDQRVHDLDHCDTDVVDELMAARTYTSFGPDTLPEARNRGYRSCRCPGTRVARRAETDIDAGSAG